MSLNAMPKLNHAQAEPVLNDHPHETPMAANDEEVVFSIPTPSIEAANDNEAVYSMPSQETANDNDAMVPDDEEKLKSVMGRLGMIHDEKQLEVIEEELSVPESEQIFTAETVAEREAGHSRETSTIERVPVAAAGGAMRKEGGDAHGPATGGGEGAKIKKGLFWWAGKFVKWSALLIAGAIGAVFALGMTTVLKLKDQAMKLAGGKGGSSGGAKKAAGGHGGGGHGGGH
ncbi:MAG: hypothetical protein ABIT47_01965 [Candidatus Paceibacterota bacterium]